MTGKYTSVIFVKWYDNAFNAIYVNKWVQGTNVHFSFDTKNNIALL